MNGKASESPFARRLFLSCLAVGAGIAGAGIVSAPGAAARFPPDDAWRPARHAQDDWYEKIPGVHRFLFDTSTAEGMRSALQFADNFYTANRDEYGLKDSDLGVVIVARHKSTAFAYNDSIWAKYSKQLL